MRSVIIAASAFTLASGAIAQNVSDANAFANSLPTCFKACVTESLGLTFPLAQSDLKNLCSNTASIGAQMNGCLKSKCSAVDFNTVNTKAPEFLKFCPAPTTSVSTAKATASVAAAATASIQTTATSTTKTSAGSEGVKLNFFASAAIAGLALLAF
ncbi:hypothetical protein HDU96_005107 [Phlyctochytrium bullatum]|nr:hypothetical protein HDU96_005107 [Phlyctochytrium bullatum]